MNDDVAEAEFSRLVAAVLARFFAQNAALAPDQHAELLARAWRVGGAGTFAENRDVFLPEDFRALRQWLHARARLGT